MLKREACERRVYRLAVLLTGDPTGAARVIEQVVGAQPQLNQLDSAHLDRLTVLRSREVPASRLEDRRIPPRISEALARLSPQQREAWIFANVYRLGSREIARAMDCSVTATDRHLEQAQRLMHGSLGTEIDTAGQRLLEYSMSLDVPEFFRRRQVLRRRFRLLLRIGLVLVAVCLAAAAIWLLAAQL